MAAIYRYAMDRIGVGEGKLGSDRWFVPGIMNCGLPVYIIEKWEATVARFYGYSRFFFSFLFFLRWNSRGRRGDFIIETILGNRSFCIIGQHRKNDYIVTFAYLYFCLPFYYFFSISIYRIIWFDFRFSLLCIFNGFDENQTDICINLYLIFGGTEYRWLPCLKTRGLAEGTRGHIRAFSGFRPRGMVFFRRQS